nr:hypothetical protein [Streptococcus infantis]
MVGHVLASSYKAIQLAGGPSVFVAVSYVRVCGRILWFDFAFLMMVDKVEKEEGLQTGAIDFPIREAILIYFFLS